MEPETTSNEIVVENKSHGALVGSIIIVLIIIIGGVYIWNSQVKNVLNEQAEVTSEDQTDLEVLENDLGSLESDLETDLDIDLEGLE